jgi:hypothetical protein
LAAAAPVALAAAIASDAVADAIDAPELLDIDVDQLARSLALISTDRLDRFESPQPIKTKAAQDAPDGGFRDAGLAGDLRPGPALAPEAFDACDGRGWAMVADEVGWRKRCGREERSCKPARPSARKRLTHLRTVRGQTPTAALRAFGVCPPSTTRRTMISRPAGVSRAFLCTSIRSPKVRQSLSNFSILGRSRMDNLLRHHT